VIVRSLIIAALLLATVPCARAASEGDNWYFGSLAGVNFTNGTPVALTDGSLSTSEGCSAQSDRRGNLLFYTDGITVYNSKHIPMMFGTGLLGNPSSSQSSLVVPMPGSAQKYYLFTTDANENSYSAGIHWNVVDLTANGGDGIVLNKNTQLRRYMSEKLTAVRHANGRDVWVITHGMDSDSFFVYLITSAGVNAAPVRSKTGPALMFGDIGYMKATLDGTRLAMASSYDNSVSVLSFDRSTGTVQFLTSIPGVRNAYGVEFSPNGQRLYFTAFMSRNLWQADMTVPSANIASSVQTVAQTANVNFGALQLAPNGRIYCALPEEVYLGEIANPNAAGVACGYADAVIDLQGRKCQLGLPNFMPAIFADPPEVIIISTKACAGSDMFFRVQPDTGLDAAPAWNFGDPGSGQNAAVGMTVSHSYARPGQYVVSVRYSINGAFTTVTDTVTVLPLPVINGGPDVTVCPGASFQMRATGALSYVWSPANVFDDPTSATPTATVFAPTWVVVRGTDANGCVGVDSVFVNIGEFEASVMPDTFVCDGATIQLWAAGGDSYQWIPDTYLDNPRSATPIATIRQPTIFVCVVGNGPCKDTVRVLVDVAGKPLVAALRDTSICLGGTANLRAFGGVVYSWTPTTGLDDPTSATPRATPQTTTRYRVTVIDTNGCSDTASVLVTITSGLTVIAEGDTSFCIGGTATLRATGAVAYTWVARTSGDTLRGQQVLVTPSVSQWYVVTGTSAECAGMDSVFIDVKPLPVVLAVASDSIICPLEPVVLSASGADTYRWTPAAPLSDATSDRPTARVSTTTTFTVIGTTNGCSDTATVTIVVEPDAPITLRLSTTASFPGDTTARIDLTHVSGLQPLYPLTGTLRFRATGLGLVRIDSGDILSTTPVGDDVEVAFRIASQRDSVIATFVFETYLGDSARYAVGAVIDRAGCSVTSVESGAVDVDNCAGPLRNVTIGSEALRIAVHPNPVDHASTIHWSSSIVGSHVMRIVDLLGTEVWGMTFMRSSQSATTDRFALPALVPGAYLLSLTNGAATETARLVVP
jgi:hypothetical protein